MSVLDRLAGAILDGAMGTELIARGLDPHVVAPESWNINRPDVVRDVSASYFAAGAVAVHTNTFGANRMRLAQYKLAADVRALNLAACLLAREARPSGRLVIGDLGPTGAIPPPEGRADLVELEECFAEQAAALAEGGVDLLHIETLYHPKEARAAIRGARVGAPRLAVVASMTCKAAGQGYATPLGAAVEAMLAAFLEEGVDGVGVNCTLSPASMMDLVRLVRARTALPLIAQPTAAPTGSPVVSPRDMATGALALMAAGATAVGGCCGSEPAHIAAMARAVASQPRSLDGLI